METVESRYCRKCGVQKAITEFHKDARSKLKIHGNCKLCRCTYNAPKAREWSQAHRDQWLERCKEYRDRNSEKLKARRRDLYQIALALGVQPDEADKMRSMGVGRLADIARKNLGLT